MIQLTTAAAILAQLEARNAVKDQIKRNGEHVSHYAAREITILAREYLSQHRAELMPDALERARAMILSGSLGKRAQRALAQTQCAEISTNAQTNEHYSNKQISVQMSGAI